MKQNKGVLLTELSLYVLIVSIVITMLTTVTVYFSRNYNLIENEGINATQYNRLLSYLIKDCKKDNISIDDITITNTSVVNGTEMGTGIIFQNGLEYSFIDRTIYKNGIVIAENIEECKFSKSGDLLRVEVKIGNNRPLNLSTDICVSDF